MCMRHPSLAAASGKHRRDLGVVATVLVDAENVRRSLWPNMPGEELEERAAAWGATHGHDVTVVWEGSESADDRIARAVRELESPVWVVTSDRELRERVRAAYAGVRAAEDPYSQVRVAEAASDVDSAWLALERNMRELIDLVTAGQKLPMRLRLRVRRDQVRGTELAIQAVDRLFENSGGRSIYTSHPIQRYWRDAHAGRVHAINDPERALSMYGRGEFGRDYRGGQGGSQGRGLRSAALLGVGLRSSLCRPTAAVRGCPPSWA